MFLVFLKLGLTSFGGPIAHLGHFRAEFVERRRWIDERGYADLVALCQFLPGPASSQVGMALGFRSAGWVGALAAWAGFTLPSALTMIAFARGMAGHADLANSGAVRGLAVVAVGIVAQAVWGMAKNACPDRARAGVAVLAALLALAWPTAAGQVAVIGLGGLIGRRLPRPAPAAAVEPGGHRLKRQAALGALAAFALLLFGLPLASAAAGSAWLDSVDGFYRAGALVFGGGHVVLPLLQEVVEANGALSRSDFLAGYAAAQAVPGPLFSFAAYLGALWPGPLRGWPGGFFYLGVIFLPGFLLVIGTMPFWESLRQRPGARAAMGGINAAVVGLLLAALYDPVWTGAIHGRAEFTLALAGFGLLVVGRVPPVIVVGLSAAAGWAVL